MLVTRGYMRAQYPLLIALGGLRPTLSCPRCRPQESMGAKGARCSMGTKAARRKTPTPTLSLVLTLPLPLPLALIKTEYWDRAGGGGNISYDR